MQTSKEKLAAQQLVLFHLGFYKGLIDGIWSTATIAAKKKFEADVSFLPAYPNLGLPFGERDKLPKDMYYDKGLIKHRGLTPEREAEILDGMKARMGAAGPKGEPSPDDGNGFDKLSPELQDALRDSDGSVGPEGPVDAQASTEPEQKPAQPNGQQQRPHQHGNKHQRR